MTSHIEPGDCWCEHSIEDHRGFLLVGRCAACDCTQFVEHAAYIQALDTLDTDDWLSGDHGLRDNRAAARHIARRRTA